MPLNQSIQTLLTTYSGSITAHNAPNGTAFGNILHIPTGSLPAYAASPWEIRIKTNPFTTTLTAQQAINDMRITLANSAKYIILGYFSVASASTTVAARLGITAVATTTNIYNIETPTSRTAIPNIANNQTVTATTSPVSNITNYYFVKLTAMVETAATGNPTYTPTISASTAGTSVAFGPSILYYRRY